LIGDELMNSSIRHRCWRCAVVLAFVAAAAPLAVSSQGTPTSDEVAIELPTVTPVPELPALTPEPPVEPPTETPEALPPLPTEVVPFETQTPTSDWTPTETPPATAIATTTSTATATPVEFTIHVESADLSFGQIDAAGVVGDAAPSGLISEPFEGGASFVVPAAVTVAAEGNGPWAITCAAMGENDFSRDMIQAGRLAWRVAGERDWTSFTAAESGPICLRDPEGGSRQFVLDVRLYVASVDPPGSFAVTLVYSVIGDR